MIKNCPSHSLYLTYGILISLILILVLVLIGDGQVILFHVTANAEWSSLPLSGLFVQMLERLSVSTRQSALSAEDLAGTVWTPDQVLSAFGEIDEAAL